MGMTCGYDDLIVRHLYAYGSCYTFNYSRFDVKQSKFSKYNHKELDLVIYKAVDIPYPDFMDPFESEIMPSGILFMIHDRETWPNIQESYVLDEYSQINLKVITKHHVNIGNKCRPVRRRYVYQDVFTGQNVSVYGKYSDCVYYNVQQVMQHYCGCQWQPMQVLAEFGSQPFCMDGQVPMSKFYSCMPLAFGDMQKEGSLDYCYLDDCVHSTYETVISQSRFPAVAERQTALQWMRHLVRLERRETEHYGVSDLARRALLHRDGGTVNGTRSRVTAPRTIEEAYRLGRIDLVDESFVERNFMMLKVVPTSIFMDTVEETEGYPVSRLLSDIGGSVGLWLGASLITLFEVFDLILDLLEAHFSLRRREKLQRRPVCRRLRGPQDKVAFELM